MIFLKALIFMNSFGLLIGLLIIFLEIVISNYGDCKITINNDKEFTAKGGKSLLKILFENRYFIPSACGGKGTCGYCKLKVIEGGGDALPTESLILSFKEIQAGYRLACQLKVRQDLNIEIPPEYLEIQEFEGMIDSSILVTSDIKKIRIKLISPADINFKPGQYVQVKFDTSDGIDYRAYSIASDPEDNNIVELNVKKIPDGLGSTYLHSRKKEDDVSFSGPYGDFYLKTDSNRKIICVAGGVGLAPLKSIVSYWIKHQNHRVLELYYGARNIKELYDHDIFVKISDKFENFNYYPALSEKEKNWIGETGFIHKILKKHLTSGNDSEAYLCGPQIMIEAVTNVLVEGGVLEERILYDKF